MAVTISASGYNNATLNVPVGSTAVANVSLVPTGKDVYVSNASGTYDVYESDLNGQNKKLLLAGTGNELTAIASVVLGGTVLTGGVGMVAGTLFGGMILGLIATLINFNGSLNGAWIMISGGVLLFLFIVMQRALLSSFRLRGVA